MKLEKNYIPPLFLFNAHLETIYPALFRKVLVQPYLRERIELPDGDFLDLDWLKQQSNKLVIIQHGLEGDSHRPYMKGMAKAFFANGFDVLAWNYRGCSQEMNRLLRFYHSGATEDLRHVIDHAFEQSRYQEIYLIGFSLGGNMTLKYLGEPEVNLLIKKAIVFSVPLHLESSCRKISTPSNRIYASRFLKSLKNKILLKSRLMDGLDIKPLTTIKTLMDFDDAYTAPLHGFQSATDYYQKCSSINFIKDIGIPTLIVNTKNDPFLADECFPNIELNKLGVVQLETPARGGHVGFAIFNKKGIYWSEQRALDWIL